MSFLISALAFLLLLSFLVMIHECGHFFAARRAGVTVEEFGFGLPPRAKTLFTRGGTRFSLNWIPFGGFVRLQGENARTERERTARGSFAAASIPARIIILTAGVFMNFLFAMVIFTIGFSAWQWVPTYLSPEEMRSAALRGEIHLEPGVRIEALTPGGTAAAAHVPGKSLLLWVDGTTMYLPSDVVQAQAGKQQVTYTVQLQDKTQKTLTVRVANGKTGVELAFDPTITVPFRSPGAGFLLALREAKNMTVQTVLGMGQLFASLLSQAKVPDGVTGIVGIAILTGQTVREGWMQYIRLVAVLSLSLAILNILPFPALDGGRLMFVLYEGIRGKPAPRTFEMITNTVGFSILILLILIITYNDLAHLYTGLTHLS